MYYIYEKNLKAVLPFSLLSLAFVVHMHKLHNDMIYDHFL